MITLRPATTNDLPTLVAMRNDLNALERAGCPHAAIQPLTLEEFAAVWGPTLGSPTHCWRVVEADGRPIGFGMIYLLFPQTRAPGAFLQWAYLAPEFRRQGTGRLLLDHLLEWARSQGARRVELQYIDGNQIAEQFWTRMGFRPYARKCARDLSS
jgi:GNAT superfamily N-acetyltransferase